ncbi:MFS transporter (plasmid) [Comamonas sp. C11]|nr:MFS transporter [Comamonas sp. C11]UUC96761.1 MFS transporter [Comamonas sp. C11]
MVYLYIIFFQGTLGPVTWLINSEIFPQRYRGIGDWDHDLRFMDGNFIVGLLSPVLLEWNMSNTFLHLRNLLCTGYYLCCHARS